ncbi:MAG TPA: multidrug ABC transporter ATP-binding protein [Treponema sp.]|nr:multidrug ABC transporter ATP-binding protein [Treponema sp.]
MASTERNTIELPRMGGPKAGGAARFAPHEKPKNGRRTFGRLAAVFLRYKGAVVSSLVLTALASAATVAVPVLTGKVFNTFDTAFRTVNTHTLFTLLCAIAALYAGSWVANTLSGVVILKVSQRLVLILRTEFFSKMQRLPLSFYDTTPRGDTMSRITNDADTISSTIAQSAAQLVSGILTLALSLAVMLSLDVPLTLAVLVCVPLVVLLTRTIAGKSRDYFYAQQRSLGILDGQIEESIHGLKMVKAFTKEDETLSRFSEVNKELCESSTKAQIWAGYMMPLMNVINNLTFTIVAVAGGILCTSHGLLIGTAVTFLGYAKQFATPLNSIAGLFNTIQSALAGAERVFEVMDETEETPDIPGAAPFTRPQGNVAFLDVGFSYDKKTPVLSHISFSAQAGHTVALVGETGSGKTTIVNLLNRFYDADSGIITIDDTDIRTIRRNDLRNCFSVVLQETSLFSGTIMDNIRYSRPSAADDEVKEAARIAHASEFIERLPQQYETHVSGSADTLSEGQRQLLAIARAVLCNSPILILDEATSSVDTKTEKEIQRALVQLRKGRTCFLIAHRLSTIRDADNILVIDNGKILENGTHAELMRKCGHYYDMVCSQTGKHQGKAG